MLHNYYTNARSHRNGTAIYCHGEYKKKKRVYKNIRHHIVFEWLIMCYAVVNNVSTVKMNNCNSLFKKKIQNYCSKK